MTEALAVLVWSVLAYGLWHAIVAGVEDLAGRRVGPDPARTLTPRAGSRFPGRAGDALPSPRLPGNRR